MEALCIGLKRSAYPSWSSFDLAEIYLSYPWYQI